MLFRYPGGKSKLRNAIIQYIHKAYELFPGYEYSEPFFGAGGVFFNIQNLNTTNICLNDLDYDVACIWNSIRLDHVKLCSFIANFCPNVDIFYKFKNDLLNYRSSDIFDTALKKIALHQMSYSGLGTKAGGPIGGNGQTSKYSVSCRWNSETLVKNVKKTHEIFNKFNFRSNSILSLDFAEIINKSNNTFLYLDPPYYIKGEALYKHAFSIEDHARLQKLLLSTKQPWILSYDDCPEIKELYKDNKFIELNVNYSINTSRNKKELLIFSKNLDNVVS